MNVFRTIISELIGLFIDDGLFATTIVLWCGLVGFVAPVLGVPGKLRAVLLFVGLAGIIVESVARYARSSRL